MLRRADSIWWRRAGFWMYVSVLARHGTMRAVRAMLRLWSDVRVA